MKLAKLLNADHIILDMKAVEHWPSIVELVEHLVTTEQLPVSEHEEILEAFRAREESVSTGIGSGVAIPHAFSDHLERVIAVFGRSKAGIDFEALDGEPVDLIFLLSGPETAQPTHLPVLARLVRLLHHDDVLTGLRGAATAQAVLKTLKDAEQHHA